MNIWIVNHYAMTPQLPGITRHFDFAKERMTDTFLSKLKALMNDNISIVLALNNLIASDFDQDIYFNFLSPLNELYIELLSDEDAMLMLSEPSKINNNLRE